MDPGPGRAGRSVDPEAAQRLRDLFATAAPPAYERPLPLIVALALVAALYAVAMPLPWYHQFVLAVSGYTVTFGIGAASWLLIDAVLVLSIAVRVAARSFRIEVLAALLAVTALTLVGMYAEWSGNYTQAFAAERAAFVGPGFYVALAGCAALLIANVLAWRARG